MVVCPGCCLPGCLAVVLLVKLQSVSHGQGNSCSFQVFTCVPLPRGTDFTSSNNNEPHSQRDLVVKERVKAEWEDQTSVK